MPRFKITINARVIDYASRSFLVDVDDGRQLRTVSSDLLNDLADESHVPWEFGNVGFVEVDEHEVTECGNDTTSIVPVLQLSTPHPSDH